MWPVNCIAVLSIRITLMQIRILPFNRMRIYADRIGNTARLCLHYSSLDNALKKSHYVWQYLLIIYYR
jgi:hypothetical protein